MADSSTIVLATNDHGDQIKVDTHVLEVILGVAAEKVDGVAAMRGNLRSGVNYVLGREDFGRGVSVSTDKDGKLQADVYVYLEFGQNIPKLAGELQTRLSAQLKQTTDLTMSAINIHVVGLLFPEDLETHNKFDEEED